MELRSCYLVVCFFKQKTAYEITYGDWSSDVCSSDLLHGSAPLHLVCGKGRDDFFDRLDLDACAQFAFGSRKRCRRSGRDRRRLLLPAQNGRGEKGYGKQRYR